MGRLRDGDQAAAQPLWERYFGRLVELAHKTLKGRRLPVADEEDMALSAFDSFCRGAARGHFPQLGDRDDLWRLLVVITARKVYHAQRDEHRLKRGGDRAAGNAAHDELDPHGVESIVGREPDPEFAAQVAEEYELRLASLNNKELERLAIWKMEGFTNDEIASRLDCAPRTVERKLRLIREIWEATGGP
jgi:DNA-directed RNA polymerase specialized sigma24 family protein